MTTLLPSSTTFRSPAPVLAGLFTIIVACLLQHRIGITDVDAENYLLGARSLALGQGYVDDFGIPLNHWPPGYSLLLSWWPDPKFGALVINMACLGLAVAQTLVLASRMGWGRAHSLALSLALGFGLYLSIAQFSKPDILGYVVFLAAILSYSGGTFKGRVLGCVLCSLLIPFKLIAVTFAPGILLAELIHFGPRPFFKTRWREVMIAGLAWGICLGGLLWYNALTLKTATPDSYAAASLHSVLAEVVRFFSDLFRSGLAFWYGSIRASSVITPFTIVAVLGLACLLSLRRSNGWSLTFKRGVAILAFCWGLEFYRIYFANPRLMGYGMILMLIGMQPLPKSTPLWCAYAAATVALAIDNHVSVNSLGLNHPVYESSAIEAAAHLPPNATVYSNSYRLLDIHAHRRSIPVSSLNGLPPGAWYWHADLPNYDAIMRPINPLPARDDSWQEQARLSGGILFRKSQ
ncbi:MAG: hypothetical protein JWO08_2435 [Verrucomicrobiaceae bacterium]|nr:hypothetical protein [Verrucomicrobiaceae bacterium]